MSATRAPLRATSPAAAAPITPAPMMTMSKVSMTSQDSITRTDAATHQPRIARLARSALAVARHGFEQAAVAAHVFAEDAVPGRDDDRYRAARLRLTGQANQRLGFLCVYVTELLDALAFERRDFRKLLSAAEHADPAGAARRRAALDRNRPFFRY